MCNDLLIDIQPGFPAACAAHWRGVAELGHAQRDVVDRHLGALRAYPLGRNLSPYGAIVGALRRRLVFRRVDTEWRVRLYGCAVMRLGEALLGIRFRPIFVALR
ncbi:conserved hypothetical protein [Xanthomonas phaseoli pv. phaseoli]|uniref:Uncharacterized protein n=1 Tax=Xanthomonas campestris pv. phaseoli TaxID=317013 RepID=A0AB38E1M0_XANCH|nr:conserved hypothetical protein [Xanthomonas phaseoli pv. phaseoli]SON86458.1 conserved hypothetical protein [Xanthomonas phaseoli pv. phaseoli]SON90787.1 conserved hypothetical protein [Xanthomonas phaseoli pv. phaseoli]SOO28292.1 conserved hypothetical protein [Xanthomonas phaseoli pv. phaseoli]